jgi:hypothetical protein
MTKVAAVAILAAAASSAQAFTLNNGDVLTIDAGVATYDVYGAVADVSNGSFFGMDTNASSSLTPAERNPLQQGTTGIVIGASNTGLTDINASWPFSGATGYNYVSTAITGSTEAGLNMSGWTVNWNGGDINMGAGGAWQVIGGASGQMPTSGYVDQVAQFSWDGVYGNAYTLDYTATVPGTTGFGGTQYGLHLEGFVQAAAPVPEASTYGMMLAGLGLVGFAVRRRKMVA